MVNLLLLLSTCKIAYSVLHSGTLGRSSIDCNYVEPRNILNQASEQANAVDVCRQYVTPTDVTSSKYICVDGLPYDTIYNSSDCSGPSLELPLIGLNATDVWSFKCNTTNSTCNYIMMQTTCDDTEPDTYSILPVLSSVCIARAGRSYAWDCNDGDSARIDYFSGNCEPDLTFDSTVDLKIDQCYPAAAGRIRSWEPKSECIPIFYGPTQDPTMEPTLDPTTDPTTNPTSPTMEPTIEPTENTYEPTQNPTKDPTASPVIDDIDPDNASFINLITNYIFVIFLVCYIYFV